MNIRFSQEPHATLYIALFPKIMLENKLQPGATGTLVHSQGNLSPCGLLDLKLFHHSFKYIAYPSQTLQKNIDFK